MAFFYNEVVPWGRSFVEYCRMFSLTEDEQKLRILGCGDGPASFNAEMTRRGYSVLSVDPLYELSTDQIRKRIDETFEEVMTQTEREQHRFVWREIPSVEALGAVRMQAMLEFLEDFPQGFVEGRYVAGALPDLPAIGHFDLALCSHLLFLYSRQLPLAFHLEGIAALLEVAREIRLFPLLDVNGERSTRVDPVCAWLSARGIHHEIQRVEYEFQRNGNQMLRIWSTD